MGIDLKFSTILQPQTNSQSEQTIHILEDLLRSCVLDRQANFGEYLLMVELAYNNSYQSNIGIESFEALYVRPCRSPLWWLDTKDPVLVGPDLFYEIVKQVELIKKMMKKAQDR